MTQKHKWKHDTVHSYPWTNAAWPEVCHFLHHAPGGLARRAAWPRNVFLFNRPLYGKIQPSITRSDGAPFDPLYPDTLDDREAGDWILDTVFDQHPDFDVPWSLRAEVDRRLGK